MFKYNILIALRSIFREKILTIVNISGLVLAFMAFILISQYVAFEKSYDDFHPDAKNIYRVILERKNENGIVQKNAQTFGSLKPAIQGDLPFIEHSVRIHKEQGVVNTHGNKGCRVKYYWIDPETFSVFSIPLKYGDEKEGLDAPLNAMISESLSQKLYGNKNPVGKTLILSGKLHFTITGVFKDFPKNSHFDTDILFSWATIDKYWNGMNNNWNALYVHTYIKLNNRKDKSTAEKELNNLLLKYKPNNAEKNISERLILQPLTNIHLNAGLEMAQSANNDKGNLNLLFISGFALLILAWINNVNLYSAKAFEKKENFIKYTSAGIKKFDVFLQVFIQLFMINFIALAISVVFIQIVAKESMVDIFGFDFFIWSSPQFWGKFFTLLMIGVTLCSVNPFLILQADRLYFRKAVHTPPKSSKTFIRMLLLSQLSISIFILSGLLIVNQQVKYMQEKPLGFSINQKLILLGPNANEFYDNSELQKTFKNEIMNKTGTDNISISGSVPGEEMLTKCNICKGSFSEDITIECGMNDVDEDFFPLYDVKFIAGRNFNPDGFNETDNIIVNKKMALRLGFKNAEDAIGKFVSIAPDKRKKIIGAVQDFHHLSMQNEVKPLVFFYWKKTFRWIRIDYYTLKINDDIHHQTGEIKKIWDDYFPKEPFEYFFLDDFYNLQYEQEKRFNLFFFWFSVLTLIINGIGLFAIAFLMIKSRSKEISLRKVNGAKSRQVIFMILKDYVIMFSISIALAIPLSVFVMDRWLEHYAYKIPINPLIYVVSVICTGIVILLTVTSGIWKTASQNPADNMKEL